MLKQKLDKLVFSQIYIDLANNCINQVSEINYKSSILAEHMARERIFIIWISNKKRRVISKVTISSTE
ncbi:MAG: hypothetical protein ACI9VT_000838 [Psychroserpens sp.]|jgi:hypothetical protein